MINIKSQLLALFFFLICGQRFTAIAQPKINPADIQKIILDDYESGLGGSYAITMEVLYEHGQWVSYQTNQKLIEMFKVNPAKSSKVRKRITLIRTPIIINFLNSIVNIKPNLDWRTFGLTPAVLKLDLQLPEINNTTAPKFEDVVNEESIKQAIYKSGKEAILDDGPYCGIYIITKNRDTVKIESSNKNLRMLPWTINKQNTYAISISDFFSAAIGNQAYPNNNRLSAKYFKEIIWEQLEQAQPIERHNYRWNYGYPDNLALITSQFKITDPSFEEVYNYCTLHSENLPSQVAIRAKINITDSAGIRRLVKYKDTINKFFKTGNFLFKYYKDKPGVHITFSYGWEPHTNINSLLSKVMIQIPVLKNFRSEKLKDFDIETPQGTTVWALLPDGMVILLYVSDTKVASSFPKVSGKSFNLNQFTTYKNFALFNINGQRLQ